MTKRKAVEMSASGTRRREVSIRIEDPVVAVVAEMKIDQDGLRDVASWVESSRPHIVLNNAIHFGDPTYSPLAAMLPYNISEARDAGLTDNEMLIELAGRGCYQSYGSSAGRKTNRAYIENTQKGPNPHKSILYHAKFTLFVAGISRRLSHEIIRHYVGADRTEELSPSQESTRYTHHSGVFICPIKRLDDDVLIADFTGKMQAAYNAYCEYIDDRVAEFSAINGGNAPVGLDRKRIYEDASNELPHSAETSMYITMNPESAAKMIRERTDDSADLEFIRFAKKLNRVLSSRYKNLFKQMA